MNRPEQLLERLNAIGESLAGYPGAFALLALGSSGLELDRLDEYSDLDFFVIVKPGMKAAFLTDLGWLSAPHPLSYTFQNTADGYKALFADGIFCEFAVFEPDELARVSFAPGRIIWKADEIGAATLAPTPSDQPLSPQPVEWLVGEALTNLYVGLSRYRRGEKLSAQRFVQVYAVDRVVELAGRSEPERSSKTDPFASERRFEERHPALAEELPAFIQGYNGTPQSARAILVFLERYFEVNLSLTNAIRALLTEAACAE